MSSVVVNRWEAKFLARPGWSVKSELTIEKTVAGLCEAGMCGPKEPTYRNTVLHFSIDEPLACVASQRNRMLTYE